MVSLLARDAIETWKLWLAQHIAPTGDVALGRRAAAEFDVWRSHKALPSDGHFGRQLPLIAR